MEVSSLGSVWPLFLFLSEIMITRFLDIVVSRPELENGALLCGDCFQLLWYWWFLDAFFLSKLFFLLHFPAFLSIYSGCQQVLWKDGVWFWPLFHKNAKWDEQDVLPHSERKFYFSTNPEVVFFHAIKNSAMGVRYPEGFKLSQALWVCLLVENKIVSLWLTSWKVVWVSQVQFEMKTVGFDFG